jgi:hypothetical protein
MGRIMPVEKEASPCQKSLRIITPDNTQKRIHLSTNAKFSGDSTKSFHHI